MARQVPVSFKDLAVRFSKEEWRLLEEGQREFYRDVMRENYEMLVSVGTTELLPLSAFLSPAEARGATGGGSRADEGQDPSAGGEPQRAQPQHSVHLTALVQLVKDIPELLFGKVEGPEDSPESRGAILDGERASPEEAANKPWPIGREGAGAPGEESSPPTCSPGQRKSHRRQERGTTETGISPGSSPLQGLIDCLKLILVPGPQHPEAAPDLLLPLPIPGASRLSGMELGPGSPPCPVKTESASGDHPLQGRLDCLKEITEAQDRHPSPLGVGDLQLQEDPGPWKRNSGGPRHLQTPPSGAGPGAGSMLTVVKVEDSWPQSPLVPASCQLGRQGHGLSATGDTKEVRTPCWGPTAQASRASSSPLEALEACLKGISPSGSSPPQPLATSWSRSPQLGDAGSQRPDVRPQGSHSEEATREPLQPQGLQGCVREGLAQPLGPRGTPASFSSASSSDGDLDFWSPRGSQGQQPGKGCLPGSSPLQELENCLKELPMPRQQPARPCSSAADREPRRAAPGNWMADEEGAAPRPSPLRCLQSSLRGILPVKPLRFACLAGPGPSPSPSSSLSSSDGEDPRLEPELWRTRLQEIDPLPSYKHPVPPSPCPGRSPRGSSPGKDPERTEPRQCHGLGAAGKAEEGTEGKSQLPRKEEGAESACPPSPLHSTRGEGEAAGCPCPAPRLEERPGPRRSEEPGGLGPGHGRCSIAAGAQGRPLPRSPPGPPSKSPPPAAVPPLRPAPSPPACPCGRPLQQELHSLSAALVERLDRLAAALAGLAQEVATVRTQVDRLERRPGSLPRGPRWASGPGHRHRPYWRQKGHTRPKPKILRARAEGCKTGNPPGLAKGRAHLVPQRPTEASLAEPSRPSCDPSQQPSSLAPSCHTVLTGHLPLGHTGCHQSPLPTSVPAAFPALVASSTPSVDAELLTVGAAPASPPHQPKESSGLRGGALREELWGGEHRDPRWGTH